MIKAIILFSGGLDSLLATKLLQSLGVSLKGIYFQSSFILKKDVESIAKNINLPLKIIDFTQEQIEIVKHPCFGFGKNLNPCLDCRLLMLKQGKKEMEKEKAEFLATGEVLGQRPFSQNKKALLRLEKQAGLEGKILRPLSAKLLDKTLVEQQGKIDREKLFAWQGKSRRKQLAKAKEWGIKTFNSPAGGCLLTDPQYSQRLKKMMSQWPDFNNDDVLLLSLGRHFWQDEMLYVVGRNKEENEKIKKIFKKGDILIWPKIKPGPTILVRSKKEEILKQKNNFSLVIQRAKSLISHYSRKIDSSFEVNIK